MKYLNKFQTQSDYDNAELFMPNLSYIVESNKVIVKRTVPPIPPTPTGDTTTFYYTSTDGEIVEPFEYFAIGNLISNTYEDGVGKMVFEGTVTTLRTNAFLRCTTLNSITLPSNIMVIDNMVFADCTSLITINIPSAVTYIDTTTFVNCENLATVIFEEGSQLTNIYNGAFNSCSSLLSIEIPSGVTYIDDYAFYACGLQSVNIPSGVTSINDNTFAWCQNLSSVNIPSGVTRFGIGAFDSCANLTDIYFDGTFAEFRDIEKGENWKFDVSRNCLVHCTDGDYDLAIFP